jgi:tetratricopeptide (TPR) repeat protein
MELLSKIIALETSCHFAEKGEDSLKSGNFSNAKDYYLQTQKLNPDLHSIQFLLQGIEKTIQQQMIRQKTHEANQAMKAFKYRQAHQLLLEAIAIAPEEKASFQSVLDDLGPLIQVSLVLV